MAGRPKGIPKTGGRKAGTPNRATQAALDIFKKYDFDPVEQMIVMLLGEEDLDPKLRVQLLRDLAPYRHPKLNTTTLAGDPDRPMIGKIIIGLTDT